MKSFLRSTSNFNTEKSLTASIAVHLVLFIIAITFKFSFDDSRPGTKYVQINTAEFSRRIVHENEAGTNVNKSENTVNKKVDESAQEKKSSTQNQIGLKEKLNLTAGPNFNPDTTGLQQIYKESTLDVSIRYPAGWTYIDQDVKNKLDGVTFWSTSDIYSTPPYIHLEVKEKYLFNPSRYKYSIKTNLYTAYYNDPEELSGQVSQEVYIRTDMDEDFSIKLIMLGKDEFKSFQPVFFGMIKSFKFGDSFF